MNLSDQLSDETLDRIGSRYQILYERHCIETEEEIKEIWLDLIECGKQIWNLVILSYARMRESTVIVSAKL